MDPISVSILESIYDSVLDNTFFDTVLNTLTSVLLGTAILLIGQDSRHPSDNFLLRRGLATDEVTPHVADLALGNPWLQNLWQEKEGIVYQGDDEIAQHSADTAKHWLALMGPMECAAGIVVNRRRTRQLVLEIRFPKSERGRLNREIIELLEGLAPTLCGRSGSCARASKILLVNN